MEVSRVLESPRVTPPYSEAQWAAIDALGRQVDGDLVAHDVRLTMGGELHVCRRPRPRRRRMEHQRARPDQTGRLLPPSWCGAVRPLWRWRLFALGRANGIRATIAALGAIRYWRKGRPADAGATGLVCR